MGISTQTITVDLSKQPTRPQVVRLGQGDKRGTTLVADVYDNGVAYNLTGKTARFSMRAPDGTASYSVVASSYNGNKATFNIDETYAASIAGKTDTAYIEVLSGSTVICSTSRITVVVYRSASQGLPVAGAYSDALSEAISSAQSAASSANAAADAAIEAIEDISELAVPEMTPEVRGGAKLGSGLDVSDGALSVSPIPDASIDSVASGDSQTGAQSLSLTGLSRLWAKMRAAFAAMSHVHSADDVTSGTLPVARGGTGVATAEAERIRLGLGGDHVLAGSDDQAVFGRYNVLDEDDAYAAIVGNGASESDRKNALGILWNGHTRRFLDVDTRQGGTKPSSNVSVGEQVNDSNGGQVFYSYTAYTAAGTILRSQVVRKLASDGSELATNGLYYGINESGTPYWEIKNAPQFRDAIGLGNSSVQTYPSEVSLASVTAANLCDVSLSAGVWIVTAGAVFNANSSGDRLIHVATTSGNADVERIRSSRQRACSAGTTSLSVTCLLYTTSATTVYLVGWQSSGTTLGTKAGMYCWRIK